MPETAGVSCCWKPRNIIAGQHFCKPGISILLRVWSSGQVSGKLRSRNTAWAPKEVAAQLLKGCGMIRSSEKCQLIGVEARDYSGASNDSRAVKNSFGADFSGRPGHQRTRRFSPGIDRAVCATVVEPYLKTPASKRGDLAASNTFCVGTLVV